MHQSSRPLAALDQVDQLAGVRRRQREMWTTSPEDGKAILQAPRRGAAPQAGRAQCVIYQRDHRARGPVTRGRHPRRQPSDGDDQTGLDERDSDSGECDGDAPPWVNHQRQAELVPWRADAIPGVRFREQLNELFDERLWGQPDGRCVSTHECAPKNATRPGRYIAPLELFEHRRFDLCRRGHRAERDLTEFSVFPKTSAEAPSRRAHQRSTRCTVNQCSLTTPRLCRRRRRRTCRVIANVSHTSDTTPPAASKPVRTIVLGM